MSYKQRGFTLIELLVVVLIISIIIGVAMLAPRGNKLQAQVKSEALRLSYLFNSASERAQISGSPLGFTVADTHYYWWQWSRNDEQWKRLSKGKWKEYVLPDLVLLSIETVNTQRYSKNNNKPQVVFYTDGLITPTTLVFSDNKKKNYRVPLHVDGVNPLVER